MRAKGGCWLLITDGHATCQEAAQATCRHAVMGDHVERLITWRVEEPKE